MLIRRFMFHFKSLMLLLVFLPNFVVAENFVTIGVLSHRGDEQTFKTWQPLADYLSKTIKQAHFVIEPLAFDEIDATVANNSIDFLLVNPGIYVTMEVRHRISRIATLNNLVFGAPNNKFAGVLFTRRNRTDIQTIADFKNKSLMAVDEISLGGYQMAWRELMAEGIDPSTDLKSIQFAGIHDAVVNAVVQGKVDIGTVRTGILESMISAGTIQFDDLKVINKLEHEGFPSLHSTRLYPEWPFSKLQNTANSLAQSVAIALLQMADSVDKANNTWKNYGGWTIPLEYQPVHDVLQELNLPPYDKIKQFTLIDAIKKYSYWLVTTMLFIIIIILMMMRVHQLNRALKKSKQRLENQYALILDSVDDGIYGVDLEGNSTFVNRAMEHITGWSADMIVGKNQHELLHHTRKDGQPHLSEQCPVYKTFNDGQSRFIGDDLFWRANGESFPVEYTSTPLKDEDSKIIGSVVVFRDISERQEAEEQLREYKTKLEHVARLSNMGEMASGMAHELNQPLTAILTNSEACIRLLESKEIKAELLMDTLEKIGGQSKRASGIIQQLRQFVKKGSTEFLAIDINEHIKNVMVFSRRELESKGIQMQLDLDLNITQVMAQPIQIDQVILNLINNAIESLASIELDHKKITIQSQQLGSFIKVSVSDNGAGIDRDILANIFTPYKTTKEQGMGLGLSISEGIILSHHGEIKAANNMKMGAEFCFTLPINGEAHV